MKFWRALVLLMALPLPVLAQSDGTLGVITEELLDDELERFDPTSVIGDVITSRAEAGRVANASGAVLRTLDKISGAVEDVSVATGRTATVGRIDVVLGECRYPVNNPSGNAFAYLEVYDAGETSPAFRGWMVADSPALSALDHARYDVWVMRCTTS